MLPRRNIQQRNVRDVMIDNLQREIYQLHQRLTRLEQRKVERKQGMQQKRRSHHLISLNDKEDNSPTVPDPGPLWSSEPIWDSEPKWDGEPNWDDNPIQLPHQSQNDLEQESHRSLMEEDRIYEKDLKPEDIVPDADAQHEDDDEIVIGLPRPPPPSSSEMLDVEEKEEGGMIGPPRPPHGTWDDGSASDLDDLPLNVKASEDAFQYFALEEKQVPLIILLENDGKKFLKPNIELDQIATWLGEYVDGKLTPFIRSEPIHEANNEPVMVVVANSSGTVNIVGPSPNSAPSTPSTQKLQFKEGELVWIWLRKERFPHGSFSKLRKKIRVLMTKVKPLLPRKNDAGAVRLTLRYKFGVPVML